MIPRVFGFLQQPHKLVATVNQNARWPIRSFRMETSSIAVQGKANRNQEQELGQNSGLCEEQLRFSPSTHSTSSGQAASGQTGRRQRAKGSGQQTVGTKHYALSTDRAGINPAPTFCIPCRHSGIRRRRMSGIQEKGMTCWIPDLVRYDDCCQL